MSWLIDKGGPMMWPLVSCSLLLVAVLWERLWTVAWRGRVLGRRLGRSQRLWHRRALPFFTDVPPGIGLLGTVLGIVKSFSLFNGRIDPDAVGAGLAMACLTTVFGLSIALVALTAGYLLDGLAAHVEREP